MRNSSCCAHALKQPEVRVEEAQLLIVRGSGGLVANLDLIEVELQLAHAPFWQSRRARRF